MKKFYQTTALAVGMFCMLGGTPAFAGNASSEMETIKQQVQTLISQNQELTQRIGELESGQVISYGATETGEKGKVSEALRTAQRNVVQEYLAEQLAKNGGQSINEFVSLSGLVEGEFAIGDDFEGNNFNEFALATVELGLDVEVNEWARGSLLALYEGGEEDDHIVIDEGFIEIGNYEKFPLSVAIGKVYVPFGNFTTNMIQDPFTLEIGEIGDFGMNIGFEAAGLYGGVFAYNGMKTDGGSNVVKGYGAQLGYAFENESMAMDAGLSYVGNIADSGGINGFFNDDLGKSTIQDQVDGLGIHAIATFGHAMIVAEYVTALDSFNDENAAIPTDIYGAEPSAWNIEFGYGVKLSDMPANFAIGMQGTDDAVELGLPETRYIVAAAFEIFPATALTFEYFYDTDYDLSDGGTDESANTFTTQLAYAF